MGIMPGGAHYAQTLGVPPLLLLLGLMVALCPDIRCSCSALMESQQTFWSRHFLSTDIMSRIAWKVGEVVIIHLINTIMMGLMRRMILLSSTALGQSRPTVGKA